MGNQKDLKEGSHTMGIRLDDESYSKLEELSKEMELKKSTLLKKALKGWATIRTSVNFENMVVIGKPMLLFLMEHINREEAIELSNMVTNNICSMVTSQIIEEQNEQSLINFLDFFVKGMGQNGKGWFNKIQVQEIKGSYRLYGTHQFGKNFTCFAYHLIKNIMEINFKHTTTFDLKINRENMISIIISKGVKDKK